jgi:hypothetical protein
MALIDVFFEKTGKPSLKRISGSIMLFNGIVGKNGLAIFALFREVGQYVQIDSTFDSLILGGVALLFGSIVDKFFKKND